jgi:hypothetical protein
MLILLTPDFTDSSSEKKMYDLIHRSGSGTLDKHPTLPAESTEFSSEFSDHFKLSKLDECIRATLDQHESLLLTIFDEFRADRRYMVEDLHYTVDKLNYKGQVVCCQDRSYNSVYFNIKLSNDGFLYSDVSKMNVARGPVKRHNHNRWFMLHRRELDSFPFAEKFAVRVLKGVAPLKVQLFYNTEQSRVDLKFLNESTDETVTYTFEPGYPENDYEDLWFDV